MEETSFISLSETGDMPVFAHKLIPCGSKGRM